MALSDSPEAKNVLALLSDLTMAVQEGRAQVVADYWEMVQGEVPFEAEAGIRLSAQLVVLDDIHQDLMIHFLPLHLSIDAQALYRVVAADITRYTARGRDLVEGKCPHEGVSHPTQSVEAQLHRFQGETYISWAETLLAIATRHLGVALP